MGLCIEIFVGTEESLAAVIGSKDPGWLAWAESLASAPETWDDGPGPAEAATAVINGGPYNTEFAHTYLYAYKKMCEAQETQLPSNEFCPFAGDYLNDVDQALSAAGVSAVSMSTLMYGRRVSRPVSTLPFAVLPLHGAWSNELCIEAQARWLARDQVAWMAAVPDTDLRWAAAVAMSWTAGAMAEPGTSVVAFCS